MQVFYSEVLRHRFWDIVFETWVFLFFGLLAWGAEWVLQRLLVSVYGADVILRFFLYLIEFLLVGYWGYMLLHQDQVGLVLGISDRGDLYRLPCREEILKDPQFMEEADLADMFDRQKRLPALPHGARKIEATVSIKEKDGYVRIQCIVRKGKNQPCRKESYAISPMWFQGYDRLMEKFRSLQG